MTLSIFRKLSQYLKFYKLDLLVVMASLTCVALAMLLMGRGFRQLVDNGLNSKHLDAINSSVLLICVLIVIFGVGSFFRSYFINNVTEKIIAQIKNEAYINLLHLEVQKFEEIKIGDIITRITSDAEQISKLIVNFLSFFIRNSLMLMGAIILMFIESPKLALIVIAGVPLLLLPLLKLGGRVRILSRLAAQSQGAMASGIEETFNNIHTLFAYNQQMTKIAQFAEQTNQYLVLSAKRLKARSLFFALSISVILSSITLVIWIGSRDIITGNMSSGQMVSFIYYAIIAGVSAGGIAELFSELQSPLASAERVFALLEMHRQPYAKLETTISAPPFSIEFSNLSFSYPSRPTSKALDNISFKITPGKFIGIVGRSGSGKSTLLQLLLKFYQVASGSITINGTSIDDINTNALRSLIAYVPQEPSIFSGTIRSNIALSKPEASDADIINAASITGVMDFVHTFKDGLQTQIGERGVRLSGGQKQKIALARALLYNPEILLLDEATSALDSAAEAELFARLMPLMKGKTIIWIAHRLSTIENADEILLIENGQLLASGNHAQLLKKSPFYQFLCSEQAILQLNIKKVNI